MLAKKTVDATDVPSSTALDLLHHVEAKGFEFAPEPGRTFYDPVTREVVTINEAELSRYSNKGVKTRHAVPRARTRCFLR